MAAQETPRKSEKPQHDTNKKKKIDVKELTSYENFRYIIDNIPDRWNVHNDFNDFSRYPSYTKFELPYPLVCRERCKEKFDMCEKQFQHEIKELINQSVTAYEALRFQRHMAISALWPPLHNCRETTYTQRHFFALTRKELQRLNYIMSTKLQ